MLWASPLLPAEDEEMRQMAQEEVETVRSQMQSLETQLEILLLPKDPLDERSIMLEVLSTPERHCLQHSTQTTNPVPTADTCMCTTEGQFSLYPEMSGPILPASSMKQQCACVHVCVHESLLAILQQVFAPQSSSFDLGLGYMQP